MLTRILLLAALAAALVPAAAEAKLIPQAGTTTLSLDGITGRALNHAGVTVTPGGSARKTRGGAITVPVVTGVADTKNLRTVLLHGGEIHLRHGRTLRALRHLVVLRSGAASAVLAQVTDGKGGCAPVGATLKRFPGSRVLVPASRRATAGLCRHRRLMFLGRLVERRDRVENGVDDATGALQLGKDGAAFLNRLAGRHIIRPGRGFGLVASTTCATAPCPPPAILGSFLPFSPGTGVGVNQIIAEARALGVNTVRFGTNAGDVKPAIAAFARAGLRVVLTIRSGSFPSQPPTNPTELAAFRARFDATVSALPPGSVVQVENEVNAAKFFGGTMAQYGTELATAVSVAHAHGLKVTNSGITFYPLTLMAWRDLKSRRQDAAADDLVQRVFGHAAIGRKVLADLRAKPFAGLRNKSLQTAWDKVSQLAPILRASRMDWVNFHWYSDDEEALATSVRYLERATGKPAVSTELGQWNTVPGVVTGHLTTTIDTLHLPLILWFDADGMPALGLHDAPGALRPNGQAFRAFVNAHQGRFLSAP